MRPIALLAIIALVPDDCPSRPSPARSLFPIVSREEARCEPGLAGAWVPDTTPPAPEVWVVWQDLDDSDSTCAVTLFITDSGVARAVLDTLEVAWFYGDSTARAAVAHDKRMRKQFRRDSTRLAAVLGEGADLRLTMWEVRTVQRPGMLLVDLSRDGEYMELMNGRSIRTHWLWKAVPDGNHLTLYRFDAAWLRTMTDSARIAVPHATIDGEIVLMAGGAELVGLMERFATDSGAFPARGAIRLHR